ncbi:hypothetical protein [Acinetobacter gerneri]|uniref:hypothetical protein n=1 Tax=Acinetobacter gerneri TaxID=202952 RepID=UPI003215E1B7
MDYLIIFFVGAFVGCLVAVFILCALAISKTEDQIFSQDRRADFEAFLKVQTFYTQLRYLHGEKLFNFDEGIGYRINAVQVGYVCFCDGDREFVL